MALTTRRSVGILANNLTSNIASKLEEHMPAIDNQGSVSTTVLALLPKRSRQPIQSLLDGGQSRSLAIVYQNIRNMPRVRLGAWARHWRFFREQPAEAMVSATETHIARRLQRHGQWLFAKPLRQAYCTGVMVKARWQYAQMACMIQRQQAEVVVVNNGHRLPECLIGLLSARLDFQPLYLEAGLLPGTTQLDMAGVNYFNSLPRHAKRYQNFPQPLATALQPNPASYIFVPLQMSYDTQIVLHGRWVQSMAHFVEVLADIASRLPTLSFVLKEHPYSKERLARQWHQRLPANMLFANDDDTQQLVANSRLVLTVNSTVGMEALQAGKPVINCGRACWAIKGLTHEATSERQLFDLCWSLKDSKHIDNNDQHWLPNAEILAGLLGYLRHEYLIPKQPDSAWQDGMVRRIAEAATMQRSSLNAAMSAPAATASQQQYQDKKEHIASTVSHREPAESLAVSVASLASANQATMPADVINTNDSQ